MFKKCFQLRWIDRNQLEDNTSWYGQISLDSVKVLNLYILTQMTVIDNYDGISLKLWKVN
jgi:hypothetical protein